ncbi:EndoU domain-containing protein [Acinetobacter seifertii]|nr:EndoU domain-containing protein [Acinetobacter seifertii]
MADGNVNIVSRGMPNKQGVYNAKISVSDPKILTKTSTMFPDSWSADRIKVEVEALIKISRFIQMKKGTKCGKE